MWWSYHHLVFITQFFLLPTVSAQTEPPITASCEAYFRPRISSEIDSTARSICALPAVTTNYQNTEYQSCFNGLSQWTRDRVTRLNSRSLSVQREPNSSAKAIELNQIHRSLGQVRTYSELAMDCTNLRVRTAVQQVHFVNCIDALFEIRSYDYVNECADLNFLSKFDNPAFLSCLRSAGVMYCSSNSFWNLFSTQPFQACYISLRPMVRKIRDASRCRGENQRNLMDHECIMNLCRDSNFIQSYFQHPRFIDCLNHNRGDCFSIENLNEMQEIDRFMGVTPTVAPNSDPTSASASDQESSH